jgi:secreted trypsin-like serine protease
MRTVSSFIIGSVLAAALAGPAAAEISGDFVMGGKVASEASWPWQVRLLDDFDTNKGFCGGSFITEQWVLTAAHCLIWDDKVVSSVVVGYGSVFQSKLKMIGSSKIFVHPDYLKGGAADIALIKLAEPVPGATWIEIATPEREAAVVSPGSKVTVTGWGALWDFAGFEAASQINYAGRKEVEPGKLLHSGELRSPDQLREVEVGVIDLAECKAAYEAFGEAISANFTISQTEICAGVPEGAKDSCYGDSGGPLVVPADNARGYMQVGVVSWGIQCGNPALPGVYGRISQFYDWVKDIVLTN